MDKTTNRYYKARFTILAKDMEMRAKGVTLTVADLVGQLGIPHDGEEYREFCAWLTDGGELYEPDEPGEAVEG